MVFLSNYNRGVTQAFSSSVQRGKKCLALLLGVGVIMLATASSVSASTTTRVDVTPLGSPDSSNPYISQNGEIVAFETSTEGLIEGDNNDREDIISYNRTSGTSQRVSLDTSGQQFDTNCYTNGISQDGQYVLFTSATSPTSSLYLRDQTNQTTEAIGMTFGGLPVRVIHSRAAAMTPDAKYIAVWGLTGDGTPGGSDDDRFYVYVYDRTTDTTERVSVSSSGGLPNNDSFFDQRGSISDDGRYVTFFSRATNLVIPDNNGSSEDVFVHDRTTGSTVRIDETAAGVQSDQALSPTMSGNGRYVAYNLTENNAPMLYVKDRTTGILQRYGVGPSNEDEGTSYEVSFSTNGEYMIFSSRTSDLVANDTNNSYDIFRINITTGAIVRMGVGNNDEEATSVSNLPSLSGDGMVLAFGSSSDNLVADDTNETGDIFIREIIP